MKEIPKIRVSWQDVDNWITNLVDYIKTKKKKFKGIYGLSRGGLVPAIMLSYRLNIPLLTAPCDNCLIVDDIADSGRSLLHYTENDTQFNKYFIATYFYHPRSIVTPNSYYRVKEDNTWIIFPWEE